MLLPLLLIVGAFLSAGVVTYGIHPNWAQFGHGLDFIMFARRGQWPLVGLSLMLSAALLALTITGRRRAWWLIGLAPILALFVHRFMLDSVNSYLVAENPPFVNAKQATFLGDNDYVVGLMHDGDAYAYPYGSLFYNPVVVQDVYDKRMLLMWSAYANRATACMIDRNVRARDLEIVSMPANALLVYDTRLGQFINGFTGRRIDGQKFTGSRLPLSPVRMPWKVWRAKHPETQVMAVGGLAGWRMPVYPYFRLPKTIGGEHPANTRVALVATTQPIVVASEAITDQAMNTKAAATRVLLWRDPSTGLLSGFDRQVGDLFPTFSARTTSRLPRAVLYDSDGQSWWTADGRAIDGPLKGEKLRPLPLEDDLFWGVVKYWYPNMQLVDE